MNVYLVGFMGTGKTAIAKQLARDLNLKYIDLDDVIEGKEGRKIKDIFTSDGENYFRKREKEAVIEITQEKNIVVATGGGVVIDADNIKRFKKSGIIICLTASPKVIFERTKTQAHRPLLNVDEPQKKIESLLKKRAQFYAQADFTIDTTKKSTKEVVEEIKDILKSQDLEKK